MILLPSDVRAALGAGTGRLPWGDPQDRRLATAHPGLVFDRCLDLWQMGDRGLQPLDQKELTPWRRDFLRHYERLLPHLRPLLERHLAARGQLVAALGGVRLRAVTASRLVVGLGSGHPTETGMVWHPTLAVPYVPGSAVKGLVRAWAEPGRGWGALADVKQVLLLFGDLEEVGQGALLFFDALPVAPPKLELDVVNVHYPDYYQKGEPPADYQSPNPITFLVVAPGQAFEFALAVRPGREVPAGLRDQAVQLLQEALGTLGAGGKTAAGYGLFEQFQVVEQGAGAR